MTEWYLHNGDCLDKMNEVVSGKVDMILCDLPYGQLNKSNTAAAWDREIPLGPLWEQFNRVIKPNGAIVLFGSGMFTAKLMMSNQKMWRYNLIWNKGGRVSGFLNAKRQPLRSHEDILVFYKKQPTYNPQMVACAPHQRNHSRGKGPHKQTNRCYGKFNEAVDFISDEKYPRSVLDFKKAHPQLHPTEKPVALLEWLIKTYTNPGECVLDATMGVGSTGVACVNTGRDFIGIELMKEYYDIAEARIKQAKLDVEDRLFND